MSFAGLLRHQVTVNRQKAVVDVNGPVLTEFGHPVIKRVSIGTWKCRIMPRSVQGTREAALESNAGAAFSSHTLYGFPFDIQPGDRLIDQRGLAYEVQGIPDDAGGKDHHIEVAANRVTSKDPEPTA